LIDGVRVHNVACTCGVTTRRHFTSNPNGFCPVGFLSRRGVSNEGRPVSGT
jgi:hypothetical protein